MGSKEIQDIILKISSFPPEKCGQISFGNSNDWHIDVWFRKTTEKQNYSLKFFSSNNFITDMDHSGLKINNSSETITINHVSPKTQSDQTSLYLFIID